MPARLRASARCCRRQIRAPRRRLAASGSAAGRAFRVSPMTASEYTIAGGLTDAARLARQAHVMAQATSAFFARVGVGPGWRCLDVGCGDGQVAIELARRVGEDGRVVGLDVDAGAVQIAREAAGKAGVAVEFVVADASEVIDRPQFDL